MTIKEARTKFKSEGGDAAALYRVAYQYAFERGMEYAVTGAWIQAELLLSSICGGDDALIKEAKRLWMIDSNVLDARAIAERTGFALSYIYAEMDAGRLVPFYKKLVTRRDFELWFAGRRGGGR